MAWISERWWAGSCGQGGVFWGCGAYHLHIEDGWGDPAFLCALVAAIDNCIHNEK